MNDYKVDDIILDTREDAEKVVDQLNEVVDTYGSASVSDLYELVGLQGNFKDNKYGWTDVSSAKVNISSNQDEINYKLTIDVPKRFK